MQWGVTPTISGNASLAVQFPLAYKNFSHWVANSRSSSTNNSSWCTGGYNGTLTNFTARSNGTEIEWIATGVQQWGVLPGNAIRWTYPIPFQNNCYYANCRAVCGEQSGDGWSWFKSTPTTKYAEFLEKDEVAYCLSVGR